MIKIVADSGCDFIKELRTKHSINIVQVPLTLQLGDNVYIDDENLDVKDFVKTMTEEKSARKTAAPSPELYLKNYEGEESIFALTLSSNLSGSYNSAMTAKQMYLEDIGNKFIHVVDSLSASVGETLTAMTLNELANQGLSDDLIAQKITEFVDNLSTYFILENYDSLVNTGRLNPYVAKLASMLSIVPICCADKGKTVLKSQARGSKKAFSKLIDIIKKEGSDFENKILAISHVCAPEKALEFKNEIASKITFKDILIVEASGLCSSYADNHGLIIAF